MGATRKFDHALLEREYVYDTGSPGISYTQLADRHGLSRSHVADIARRGRWFEKRREVRMMVGDKVIEQLTDDWAETEAALRKRTLQAAVKMLDKFEKDLDDDKVKITPRDALGAMAAIRTFLGDQSAAENQKSGPTVIDMETVPMDAAKVPEMYEMLKRLTGGKEVGNGIHIDIADTARTIEGNAPTHVAAGAEGTEQD